MKKVLGIIKYLVLIGALLAIFIEVGVINFGRKAKPEKASCIIILGCQVYGSTPSPFLRHRLDEGISLYKDGFADYIIVSGGKGQGEDITEAEAMKRYLMDKGLDEKIIICEDKSINTMENLSFSKAKMEEHKLESAVVVSNKYHLKRVSLMANKLKMNCSYSGVFISEYKYIEYKGYLREGAAVIKFIIFRK